MILFVGLIATRARPGGKNETQEIHEIRDPNDEGMMRNGAKDTRDSCYSAKKIDPIPRVTLLWTGHMTHQQIRAFSVRG